ncbi:MAG: FecR domain-containing protein [Burkholderiales bacterium]|nr:FecR domain-containing protein [Burkholderiales bacterium]
MAAMFWRRGLAAVVLLVCCGAPVLAARGDAAEILDIQGRAEQRPNAADPWAAARAQQVLAGGAFVRTLQASKLALLFADETQVRLNQNTVLEIKPPAGAGNTPTLRLELGRAWTQARRVPQGLNVETPAATAAIRGTDWELEVAPDGRTTLVVLSGSVDFFNAQGTLTVGRNEAAVADVGHAPVRIVLLNPRDRVQWVNALRVDPRPYADAAARDPALAAAVDALQTGDAARARTLLEAAARGPAPNPAAFGLLAEIALVAGDFDRAIADARAGLALAPRDPELLAQLARAQLLADRVGDAEKTLAQPRERDTASILIAQGEAARRDGRAQTALSAFDKATAIAPDDDRAWFALGRAQGEREDTVPASANLGRAIRLYPLGAGYQGELGTVDTVANRFGAAQAAFDQALRDNPGDYVALTGLGLLRLKRGDPQGALDALLRAGVMEPRYARAKVFTGVAYYQLGRAADAIAMMYQAHDLDDKDPLPFMLLTQIYTDLFRAGDAVTASREALQRLPYLKSLNQVADDQRGKANLGYALAFFGLEDWALEVAQDSYNAFSGASHLFLADRYPGEFNKNSELFQGFLTDPTAFGASNRFSKLVPTAGNYQTLGGTLTKDNDILYGIPYLRVNGLVDWPWRTAYYGDVEHGWGNLSTQSSDPDGGQQDVSGRENVEFYAFGLGAVPTDQMGLFAYGTKFRDVVTLNDYAGTTGSLDKSRIDAGLRWKFTPQSMTWLKVGQTEETRKFENYFVFNPDLTAANASSSSFASRPQDAQFRHTLDVTPADHVAFGFEYARDKRNNNYFSGGVRETPDEATLLIGYLNEQSASISSKQAYVSYVRDVTPTLSFQADVFWEQFNQSIDDFNAVLIILGDQQFPFTERIVGQSTENRVSPRVGVVWKPGPVTLRAAYQQWTQPASVSTLAPVATAGIPLDDQLVASGGEAKRGVLQVHWEPDGKTALDGALNYTKVKNLSDVGFRIPVPEIEFLALLRQQQLVNVATLPLAEGTPDYDAGTLKSVRLSVNRILTPEWSVAATYVRSWTSADVYYRGDDGTIQSDNGIAKIPYVPDNLFALGATYVSPQRIYASARAVYRSLRYTDRLNTPDAALQADWSGSVVAYWESADKRVIVGAGAVNLGSKALKDRYVIDVTVRF